MYTINILLLLYNPSQKAINHPYYFTAASTTVFSSIKNRNDGDFVYKCCTMNLFLIIMIKEMSSGPS